MTKLIGIVGRAGVGKSTVAQYLVQEKGFVCVPFAAPLKRMLRSIGLSHREVDGDLKERPCESLLGKSPRYALQRLGTEWGRDLIHPDLWIELWRREAQRLIAAGHSVVADDCRFPNEASIIRSTGGKIIGVRNDEELDPEILSHASEAHTLEPDVKILNAKISFDDLQARVNGALKYLEEEHHAG